MATKRLIRSSLPVSHEGASFLILPREAKGPLRWQWQPFTLTHTDSEYICEHTCVGPLAVAHSLFVAILPTVCPTDRIREKKPTHRLSCGGGGGPRARDANGISMGLEPRSLMSRKIEEGLRESERKPPQKVLGPNHSIFIDFVIFIGGGEIMARPQNCKKVYQEIQI